VISLPRARAPPAEMIPAKEGAGKQERVRVALNRGGDQREEREGEDVALHRFGGYKLLKGIPVIFLCFGAKSFSVLWWKKFFCALVQKADRTIQFFFLQ